MGNISKLLCWLSSGKCVRHLFGRRTLYRNGCRSALFRHFTKRNLNHSSSFDELASLDSPLLFGSQPEPAWPSILAPLQKNDIYHPDILFLPSKTSPRLDL
ncbi:hypothetical protein O6H91_04G105100 [Diphasiastrum complanatum]|uniref:Uncharacterized protein n=2 Tax=Diphasiastrum complanatum TaxID=34168 RepID=A0ACC2E0C2_DIPCM|nr:hypothetical protein O6H91_04G105100 [Diphasiastrum complanatum]KAJ7559882.1 hypothetical protein O6H91_04G105100 [Diphasiastrum complanatum]